VSAPHSTEPKKLSNLQLRIMSSIVLAAAVLAVTWLGGAPFRVFAALMALAIVYEWTTISRKSADGIVIAVGAAGLCVAMAALAIGQSAETVILLTAVSALLALAIGVARGGPRETALSVAYAGAAGLSLAFVRGDTAAGLKAVLFLFAVVWATDILAYFVGRALGGPKLAPRISPGKTWSGAIGGTVGGVLGGVLLAFAVGSGQVAYLALVALLLSVVSQLGDLFESAIKRRHGAKDSGTWIPGHGGVMDRVDGLVAAAFALYLIGAAVSGLDNPAQGLFPEQAM